MQKRNRKKTALANKTSYTLVWYALYDLRPGNGVGSILTALQPAWGVAMLDCVAKTVFLFFISHFAFNVVISCCDSFMSSYLRAHGSVCIQPGSSGPLQFISFSNHQLTPTLHHEPSLFPFHLFGTRSNLTSTLLTLLHLSNLS